MKFITFGIILALVLTFLFFHLDDRFGKFADDLGE